MKHKFIQFEQNKMNRKVTTQQENFLDIFIN